MSSAHSSSWLYSAIRTDPNLCVIFGKPVFLFFSNPESCNFLANRCQNGATLEPTIYSSRISCTSSPGNRLRFRKLNGGLRGWLLG